MVAERPPSLHPILLFVPLEFVCGLFLTQRRNPPQRGGILSEAINHDLIADSCGHPAVGPLLPLPLVLLLVTATTQDGVVNNLNNCWSIMILRNEGSEAADVPLKTNLAMCQKNVRSRHPVHQEDI